MNTAAIVMNYRPGYKIPLHVPADEGPRQPISPNSIENQHKNAWLRHGMNSGNHMLKSALCYFKKIPCRKDFL